MMELSRGRALVALLAGFVFLGASPVPSVGTDVAIETTAGTIVVRLDTEAAPITTKNFLRLVDAKAYDDTSFYRTVWRQKEPDSAIEVIQGGLQPALLNNPIPIEPTAKTGLHNTNGAISMARQTDPNSATSEFFICIGDNTFLDSQKFADHAGYAAFGYVVRGFDVVLRINHASSVGQKLTPPVKIIRIRRVR
jgi:peptidyl-prolyl cis-trans isomerase A (cyclophilin A)